MRQSLTGPARSTLWSIYALSFFCSFGNPMAMPLLSFIADEFSLTPFRLSLMISFYALPGACVLPVFGVLEDRLGRKPVLLGGLLLCIFSSLMCFTASSYEMLLFWRALQGLSATPMEALSNTLITDNFQGEERTRQLGRCMACLYTGGAVFPLLSGAVLYISGDWRCSFLIPLTMAALIFLLWLRQPMAYNAKEAPCMGNYMRNVRSVLKSRTLLSFYLARALMAMLLFGVVYAYLSVLVTDRMQASPHSVAPLFAVFSAMLALSCFSCSRLTRRFSRESMGMFSGVLLCVMMLAFLLAPSAGWLLPFLAAGGIAQGLLTALVTVGVASCATPDTRATILSLYSTLFRISQTASPFLTGMIFIAGGFPALLGFAALFSLVLGVQCRMAFRRVTAGAE